MARLSFYLDGAPKPSNYGDLRTLASRVARLEKLSGTINVVFTDDASLRELNKKFRKLDKTTDVLSFPYQDSDLTGEIFINTDKAKRQAPKWNNSYENELCRLLVHGILHIAGHDHHRPGPKRIMEAKENEYLGLN